MRRRSLGRTVARTAPETAGAVAGSQQQKAVAAQQQAQMEAAQQQALIEAAAQQAVTEQMAAQAPAGAALAPAAASAPVLTDDVIAQLQKLGELHASGVLNDEEFATGKAKLINRYLHEARHLPGIACAGEVAQRPAWRRPQSRGGMAWNN